MYGLYVDAMAAEERTKSENKSDRDREGRTGRVGRDEKNSSGVRQTSKQEKHQHSASKHIVWAQAVEYREQQ